MTPRKTTIDEAVFAKAFSRDSSYSNPDSSPYLNKPTGDIIWVFDEDQVAEFYGFNPAENRFHREQIESNSEQYLLIESTSHGEHHLLLLAFLESDWTNDNDLKNNVKDWYLNSIGGWKANVRNNPLISIDPEEVISCWYQFVDDEIKKMMEKYLLDNGVEYEWCG